MNGGSLDVGTFRGNVYFTETHAGYQVVTTIADGEAGSPVRFEVTLAEGQGMTISTPRGVDEPSDAVQISHVGGKLFVMPVIVPGPNLVTAGP